MMFKIGQRYVSQAEPTLGLGIVSEVQGRTVKILFPSIGQARIYRTDEAKGVSFVVDSVREDAGIMVYVGRNGKEMKESELSSKISTARPAVLFKALADDEVCSSRDFLRHEDAMEMYYKWISSPVRGMIGPRVNMIPHQYYLCYRACSSSTLPRLMLSDEVGLGKTIEAGMIWHALKSRGRIQRTLVIVPETLKHQWMIEMKRRFNQLSQSVHAE